MRFEPTELTDDELRLQAEVRAFLEAELPRQSFAPGLGMGAAKDAAFSKALAARGWVGMALPARYGGRDRSAVDRFVVVEELLRWGAPVGHHWVADRQTGPTILRYGTEDLKRRFLPAIARAEVSFLDRHERTRQRQRPRLGHHQGRAVRGRVVGVGSQDLDQRRTRER